MKTIPTLVSAIALVAFMVGPAFADHVTRHDEVARGSIKALDQRVFDLELAAPVSAQNRTLRDASANVCS